MPIGEPERLLQFTDEELYKMLEKSQGLEAAALREVLILRHQIHRLVANARVAT